MPSTPSPQSFRCQVKKPFILTAIEAELLQTQHFTRAVSKEIRCGAQAGEPGEPGELRVARLIAVFFERRS